MSTTDQKTLATFAKVAEDVWPDVRLAEGMKSVAYVRLAEAKPSGCTAAQLYGALPKDWQKTCKDSSFGAQLSLAGRIVREFEKAKAGGSFKTYPDAMNFVAKKGSLDAALKVLNPAKAEPKAEADPKVGGETKAVKVTFNAKDTNIDPFADACRLIDQMNENDVRALAMYVADCLAKFEAKALATV